MKYSKTKQLFIPVILIAALIIYTNCQKNSQSITQYQQRVSYFSDISKLPAANDNLTIQNAVVNGEMLNLSLSFSGGCEEHEIYFYIRDGFNKSNPPQAEIYICHQANNDLCEAFITETHHLNLSKLADLYRDQFQVGGDLILKIFPPNSNSAYSPAPIMRVNL